MVLRNGDPCAESPHKGRGSQIRNNQGDGLKANLLAIFSSGIMINEIVKISVAWTIARIVNESRFLRFVI
ncbi:hypothetical protein [Paenibacillus sp. MER TA 81-3]|uniref:hypothetical protein n=1 Tax=Paenibacillus sp. MER TA 81-3 TaxID=2939573 RepID=UPI00203B9492|nr:hypothetical protein [Paenibacillus sp. MER TA 81-3]